MLILFLLALDMPIPAEPLAFRQSMITVVDQQGSALFRSSGDYALAVAKNPGGKAFAYDRDKQQVRISAGEPALWVSCSDLVVGSSVCSDSVPPRSKTRSIRLPGKGNVPPSPEFARGLPSCPGDPRCPKT